MLLQPKLLLLLLLLRLLLLLFPLQRLCLKE
jgi:hypothetical protein